MISSEKPVHESTIVACSIKKKKKHAKIPRITAFPFLSGLSFYNYH